MEEKTERTLEFLKEISKFKQIGREVFLPEGRRESDAEHVWHIVMFLVLFENELPKDIDFKRTIKIALVHDLPEIYAGDTFAFDKEGKEDKKEREAKASKELFSQLPEDLENEFKNLFEEYENQETKESKIVKSFDKIQPILQNVFGEGESWKNHNISLKEIKDYKNPHMEHDGFIKEIYEKLMKEVKDRGLTKD